MTLRQACAAVVLSLTLAISVFAGTIDCPGVVSTGTGTSSATTTIILTVVSLTL